MYLSYICTLGIPFASNWSGLKILTIPGFTSVVGAAKNDQLTVYPNPAHDELVIQLPSVDLNQLSLTVNNSHGQIIPVYYSNCSSSQQRIYLSSLSPGIYTITVLCVARTVQTQQVRRACTGNHIVYILL